MILQKTALVFLWWEDEKQERKREIELRETRTEDGESCHGSSLLFVFLYISDSNKCFKCSLDSLSLSFSACLFKHLCAVKWRKWENVRDPCCPVQYYSDTAWIKAMNCLASVVFTAPSKRQCKAAHEIFPLIQNEFILWNNSPLSSRDPSTETVDRE